jgi:hypothetical protein
MRDFLLTIRATVPAAMLLAFAGQATAQGPTSPHLVDLRERGREPVAYVLELLDRHDVVVFDDGLHTLVEPF